MQQTPKCGDPVSDNDWKCVRWGAIHAKAYGGNEMEKLTVCDWVRTVIMTDEQKEIASISFPEIPLRQAYKLYVRSLNSSDYIRAMFRRLVYGKQI